MRAKRQIRDRLAEKVKKAEDPATVDGCWVEKISRTSMK